MKKSKRRKDPLGFVCWDDRAITVSNGFTGFEEHIKALGECDPNWFKEASEKHSQDSHISQTAARALFSPQWQHDPETSEGVDIQPLHDSVSDVKGFTPGFVDSPTFDTKCDSDIKVDVRPLGFPMLLSDDGEAKNECITLQTSQMESPLPARIETVNNAIRSELQVLSSLNAKSKSSSNSSPSSETLDDILSLFDNSISGHSLQKSVPKRCKVMTTETNTLSPISHSQRVSSLSGRSHSHSQSTEDIQEANDESFIGSQDSLEKDGDIRGKIDSFSKVEELAQTWQQIHRDTTQSLSNELKGSDIHLSALKQDQCSGKSSVCSHWKKVHSSHSNQNSFCEATVCDHAELQIPTGETNQILAAKCNVQSSFSSGLRSMVTSTSLPVPVVSPRSCKSSFEWSPSVNPALKAKHCGSQNIAHPPSLDNKSKSLSRLKQKAKRFSYPSYSQISEISPKRVFNLKQDRKHVDKVDLQKTVAVNTKQEETQNTQDGFITLTSYNNKVQPNSCLHDPVKRPADTSDGDHCLKRSKISGQHEQNPSCTDRIKETVLSCAWDDKLEMSGGSMDAKENISDVVNVENTKTPNGSITSECQMVVQCSSSSNHLKTKNTTLPLNVSESDQREVEHLLSEFGHDLLVDTQFTQISVGRSSVASNDQDVKSEIWESDFEDHEFLVADNNDVKSVEPLTELLEEGRHDLAATVGVENVSLLGDSQISLMNNIKAEEMVEREQNVPTDDQIDTTHNKYSSTKFGNSCCSAISPKSNHLKHINYSESNPVVNDSRRRNVSSSAMNIDLKDAACPGFRSASGQADKSFSKHFSSRASQKSTKVKQAVSPNKLQTPRKKEDIQTQLNTLLSSPAGNDLTVSQMYEISNSFTDFVESDAWFKCAKEDNGGSLELAEPGHNKEQQEPPSPRIPNRMNIQNRDSCNIKSDIHSSPVVHVSNPALESFPGFITAGGKDISVSEAALQKAKCFLDAFDNNKDENDKSTDQKEFTTDSELKMSKKSLRNTKEMDNTVKCVEVTRHNSPSHLSTACQHIIAPGQRSLLDCGDEFTRENNRLSIKVNEELETISMASFKTAGGASVSTSVNSIQKASRMIESDGRAPMMNTTSGYTFDGSVSSSSTFTAKNEMNNRTNASGHSKPSGDADKRDKSVNSVSATTATLTCFAGLCCDDVGQPEINNGDISSESNNLRSEDVASADFHPATVNIIRDSDIKVTSAGVATHNDDETGGRKSVFPGFQTAGGNKVTVSNKSYLAAKKLLNDVADANAPSGENGESSFGFQTAMGKKVAISECALKEARTLLDDPAIGDKSVLCPKTSVLKEPSFANVGEQNQFSRLMSSSSSKPVVGFQTASGNAVSVSSKALTVAKKLLDGFDNDCLDLVGNTNKFSCDVFNETPKACHVNPGFNASDSDRLDRNSDSCFGTRRRLSDCDEKYDNGEKTGVSNVQFSENTNVQRDPKQLKTAICQTTEENRINKSNISSSELSKTETFNPENQQNKSMKCPFLGFQTAKGGTVDVSVKSLNAARQLLADVDNLVLVDIKGVQREECERTAVDDQVAGETKSSSGISKSKTTDKYAADIRQDEEKDKMLEHKFSLSQETLESAKALLSDGEFDDEICDVRRAHIIPVTMTPEGRWTGPVQYKQFNTLHQAKERNPQLITNKQNHQLDQVKSGVFSTPYKKGSTNETRCSSTSKPYGFQKPYRSSDSSSSPGDKDGSRIADDIRRNDLISSHSNECGTLNEINNEVNGLQSTNSVAGGEVRRSRLRARIAQINTIQSKEQSRDTKPLTGKLYTQKSLGKQVKLKEALQDYRPRSYSKQQLYSFGVKPRTLTICATNAEDFTFLVSDFYGEDAMKYWDGVCAGDGGFLVFSDDNTIGKKEFCNALLAMSGVEPRFITKDWIYNHYKWIIWKLAAMEVGLPQHFGG
ncbi:hypothetical protein LSH36_7g21024, partial [Paralvinella palmiformis]